MLLRLALSALLLTAARAKESHWAYTPPQAREIPAEAHPVDTLLKDAWQKADLEPSPLAPPTRWLERAAYTLTGLPPSPAQLQRLAASPDDATWRALIDELLTSPTYGERWARHWMDVARYADTWGYNFQKDNRYPHSYTYRDWLIHAFNNDLPYDQFIKLQLAADHLVDKPDHPNLAALGFLTVGPRHGTVETLDDRVDVITRGFLSSTIACARCHDHKTDPFSQQDYYSFYSILENTREEKPAIGKPADEKASADFEAKKEKLLHDNHIARHKIAERLRTPESIAKCLELAWLGRKHNWTRQQAEAEATKHDVLRSRALDKWRKFLGQRAWGKNPSPRLARWAAEMENTPDPKQLCQQLAREWVTSLTKDDQLGKLAKNQQCPLSYDAARIGELFNQTDGNEQRDRDGALARLQASHAGAPPRAMALRDREQWSPAQVYNRGNPADRDKAFPRHWPTILGGQPYAENKSPRLAMAERIADRSNPLTARVIVNRVWHWHFGAPLADLGDFGPQQPAPQLQPLLDTLAVWFMDHDWSIKELHRLLLTSRAFRLTADYSSHNAGIDEANSLVWRWNRQRLDFESARDRLLHSSGTLQTHKVGGRSIDLSTPAANPRRSLYAFLDRFALPGLFVNFDVPHPDQHAPRRIQTTVPQQALFFLNNTLPVQQAAKLAVDPAFTKLPDPHAKVHWIYQRLFRRPPTSLEAKEAVEWITSSNNTDYAPKLSGYWQIGYRPNDAKHDTPLTPFPLFDAGVWKTGKDLSKAPIPYLSAGSNAGHASGTHTLVLRWIAHGAGEIKLDGSLRRTQKGGNTLHWSLADNDGRKLHEADFPPETSTKVASPWIKVQTGHSLDFILRAPTGATCGSVTWDLNLTGRESSDGPILDLGSFQQQFPTKNAPRALPSPDSPWADLIQALWASNEFNFIN